MGCAFWFSDCFFWWSLQKVFSSWSCLPLISNLNFFTLFCSVCFCGCCARALDALNSLSFVSAYLGSLLFFTCSPYHIYPYYRGYCFSQNESFWNIALGFFYNPGFCWLGNVDYYFFPQNNIHDDYPDISTFCLCYVYGYPG